MRVPCLSQWECGGGGGGGLRVELETLKGAKTELSLCKLLEGTFSF